MSSDIWFAVVTISCITWIARILLSKQRRVDPPLPPGPRGLPVIGSLPFLDPELHTYFAELTKKYGPLVTLRLGKTTGVVVGSPSAAKEVLRDMDLTFANRDVPVAGKAATYGGLDIVWSPYGPEWRMLRRVCVREMLSSTTLDTVYDLRKQEVQQTMSYLREHSGHTVNVGDQMFLTIMNVVTSMLWGGTVKGEERARLGADFRAVVSDVTALLGVPNVSDFFPGLARFDLQGIAKKMHGCAKRLDDIFEAVIDRRRKRKNDVDDEKDFLQFILELKDAGDSKTPLTMVHVKALLTDMIVGGTDTTSNAIEFAMAEIVNKPEVMLKAQQELERVVGIANSVEESHIHHLPYLRSIMMEALRLHPVLPLMVPHCSTQSCVVGGYTIPKGSRVFINVWDIQRDPSLWEDPVEFRPERFSDGKYDFSGGDFSYFPFGSGRRMCAGVAMAERTFLLSLASLLHCFDWKLPGGVEKVDLSEKFGIVLKKRTPLLLVPTPRWKDPSITVFSREFMSKSLVNSSDVVGLMNN